ncbi:threonine dehydrogenase-like Zn-dependent dehydrogenase [Variovorax paradoxus]|uniref:MDR/zinc-dependent alcohol dehydrogenase-like family protein n=1 Tax=Variovorax paradoxus TaxID=34073 RepID=UPI00278DA8A7|nr:zinc-binding dehydrogenase [Variovorax paradoxus]MDQ0571135.1 threonine dehydrogenase-like Zn-dependent dehydrogenase [Variovorax paradoxus]
MFASVIASPGQAVVRRVETPEPAAGQVLLKLEGSGVCASSLPLWEGRSWFEYPQPAGAPGHEGWGRVAAVGEGVEGLAIGDRVAALTYRAHAEYDVADAGAVVPLPASLADVAMPGEPLGCAVNIFRRSDIQAGQTVAIVGIGFLGAILTRLAARAGARVIAISRRPFALEVAREAGAEHTLAMDDHWRILDEVKRLTGEQMCERTIEAVGLQWPLDLAGELTGERGRLVVAGYHQDGTRQVNMQMWNWRGIDVINAHERDPRMYVQGIREAVDMMAAGVLDAEPLFTHRLPLDRLGEALELTRTRPDGFLKAVVTT